MPGFLRQNRLVSPEDFRSVFAHALKVKNKYLIALYRSNSLSHARIGIVIKKQHVKLAVDRNLLRRIARESFRNQQETLKGLDIIVLIRSECTPLLDANLDKKAGKLVLREDIDQLWQRLAKSLKTV